MMFRPSFFLLALCGPGMALVGQPTAGVSPAPAADSTARIQLPSATLQPSLDVLNTALGEVRIDRWKGSSAIRGEAETNVGSIQRDMQSTLPALLATADAAPNSAAKVLPVYRNVEALYDVLLRVTTASRIAAPADQSDALDQALARLEDGRRALGDRLQANADTQELQVVHLQAALKAIPPPAPPPPPPAPPKCPTPTVRKRKPATKTARPAQPAATSQKPATPSQ